MPPTGYKFHLSYTSDGVIAQLDGAITAGATTLVVDALPLGLTGAATEVPFVLQIDSELLVVTSMGSTPFLTWTITRAHSQTTAASHADGADIAFELSDVELEELRDLHAPTELYLPAATSPSQTTDGQAVWDSDDDKLTIGTGAARKTLVNDDDARLTDARTPTSHNHTTADGTGVLTNDEHDGFIEMAEIAAPATPASGKVRVYPKADGHLYQKDDAGAETDLTSGGASAHDHTSGDGSGVLTADEHDSYSEYAEVGAPSTPASGKVRLYAKADGHFYQKDDGGTETDLTAGGASSGAMVLLDRQVAPVGGAASITFSSISGSYEDLQLRLMGRTTQAALNTDIRMIFNGDTGNNYDYQVIFASGVTEDGAGSVAQAQIIGGSLTGATAPANAASQSVIDIFSYARTVFQKTVLIHLGVKRGTVSTDNFIQSTAGWWRSTAAITSITLTPASGNFAEGTVASLFGVD